MRKSTKSQFPRKPKKPRPDFPLSPHASGKWCKKIRGTIHYFGNWARRVEGVLVPVEGGGWKEAEAEYNLVAADLHAGRTPRVQADGLTVKELANRFLTSRLRKVEAGEMTPRTFRDYRTATDAVVKQFGAGRLVDDLAADDFAALRAACARKWGPVSLSGFIVRVRSLFKYATDNALIEKAVRFGTEFNRPDKATLRRHRAKGPAKLFTAEELRAVIGGALVVGADGPELVKPDPRLKAMVLLAINGGLGNSDCAGLRYTGLDLAGGWLDYPRQKTGVARRIPLWPETVEAIRAVEATRPKPKESRDCGRLFLSAKGNALVTSEKSHKDVITIMLREHLQRLGIYRPGLSFYAIRHTFRTIADASKDQPAIDHIMGHSRNDMASIYREGIEDSRLRAVADHVRRWLWPDREKSGEKT